MTWLTVRVFVPARLQQIGDLQRECNESAAEIQRLRRGDGLPSLGPRTLHDDLSHLKRIVMPEGGQQGGQVRLPAAVRGGAQQAAPRQTR